MAFLIIERIRGIVHLFRRRMSRGLYYAQFTSRNLPYILQSTDGIVPQLDAADQTEVPCDESSLPNLNRRTLDFLVIYSPKLTSITDADQWSFINVWAYDMSALSVSA